jgi:hypothetical protein
MRLDFTPLERWLHPNATWDKTDARLYARAKKSGTITEEAADRLMLRYAKIQLELVHPDYHP